jgi:hypothetical protein
MRQPFLILASIVCMTGAAMGQQTDAVSPPRRIGNRANGFSYQPSPSEVRPQEQIAGVRPSIASQALADQDLKALDRTLLHSEGLSTSSVPMFRNDH